ncbi:MAG TPA: prepilin-type N-terminal cleavage/methylation domain-containing protein [Candidatus Pacearchaeota archaeon]|nr:prepilin-type N-terminal cleavage/methylation domain-containing protein [Candidatus Pacearchaeota archaeon]HOC53592.1 prepilin-type N-terminal cleavage/methylation domain-containing protein [Candidatus Pacearchaeota archaeon]HQM24652.1 prepilin-type N-terminal cleavage/methylation domain-containing protein [Candidatus Pacearchaeota archaeon]
MNKKIQSFTLIEILVVIVVIGILSSFILVGMSSMSSNANIAKIKVWAESARNSQLTNIVSEYKFEGPTATGSPAQTTDIVDSWGSNAGAIGTAPTVLASSSCALGKCLNFASTSSQYIMGPVTTTGFDQARTQLSVFAWIKASAQAGDATVVGIWDTTNNRRSWVIQSSSTTNFFKASFSDDGTNIDKTATTTAGGIFDNKWHYIGFTLTTASTDTITTYVDGSSVANTVSPSTNLSDANGLNWNSAARLTIGAHNAPAAAGFFNGAIDNIITYKTVVSSSQVKEQYFAGLNSLLASGEITKDEYSSRLAAK